MLELDGYRAAMPVSESPRTATSHLEAEVRKIVRTLRSYGPMHEQTLRRVVGGSRWRHGSVHQALIYARENGRIRAIGSGFYESG